MKTTKDVELWLVPIGEHWVIYDSIEKARDRCDHCSKDYDRIMHVYLQDIPHSPEAVGGVSSGMHDEPSAAGLIHGLSREISELTHVLREINCNNEIKLILQRIEEKVSKMAETIDVILADVEEEKTLIAGITTFIDGLKEQIASAGTDKTKLAAVVSGLEANKAALAAALAANVPPANPPIPV